MPVPTPGEYGNAEEDGGGTRGLRGWKEKEHAFWFPARGMDTEARTKGQGNANAQPPAHHHASFSLGERVCRSKNAGGEAKQNSSAEGRRLIPPTARTNAPREHVRSREVIWRPVRAIGRQSQLTHSHKQHHHHIITIITPAARRPPASAARYQYSPPLRRASKSRRRRRRAGDSPRLRRLSSRRR